MSDDLALRLAEDRMLRDSALALFKSDLALLRGDLGERGIGTRVKERLGDAALSMVDDAIDYTEENTGIVAAATAAVVLWFARKPILHWLADLLDGSEDAHPRGAEDHSAEAASIGD